MGIDSLGQAAVLSGLTIALSSLPGMAIDLNRQNPPLHPEFSVIALQTFPNSIPQQNISQPDRLAVRPTLPPLPLIVPPQPASTESAIVTVTCDVLPQEGLTVRRQPNLDSAAASVLQPGTYNLRFTGATETIGRRRLSYIVAPVQGWIEVLTQGGVSTLGGESCG